jgi:hypothetical protein
VTASFADNEIWHVLVAADDMKRMNVEQLDDAFRLSLVDASTMVWKAGMKTWQSLGAVAGIEDEPETVVRWIEPPPPPRPLARPAPRPPSPSRKPAAMPAGFQTAHTAITPVFAAPLVAPVYTPALQAPDPYVLPKRRVAIPSEVDFRRASGGVRWGRWLVALLLLTGGVLGAYRQNLLREGARRMGVENKYIAGERRVTAFVTAKAPPQVKQVLTRLALLPGPNAAPPPVARAATPSPAPAAAAAAPIAATATPAAVLPSNSGAATNDPEVKTVSLDSLPVLGAEAEAAPKEAAPTVAAAPRAKAAAAPMAVKAAPAPAQTAKRAKATPVAEKPEPVAKAEPKPKAKAEPPPPANENPLKAAIRQAIAADAAKKK